MKQTSIPRRKPSPSQRILSVLFVWMLFAANTAFGDVTVNVNRTQISLDETLTLIIRVDEATLFSQPDLTPLNKDFEVNGTSTSTRTSIVNGRSESFTEWHVSLTPRRAGRLTIPPIRVGNERSKPLGIAVSKSTPSTRQDSSQIIFEAEFDKDEVYVQEQIILTIRLLRAVAIGRNASITEPKHDTAFIRPLGNTEYEKTIAGVSYRVYEQRYAIFPQVSGELTIDPLLFKATIPTRRRSFGILGDSGTPVRLRTESLTATIKPQNTGFIGKQWLPAKNISMVETWSSSPDRITVGEPITRTVTIMGLGMLGAQLPPLQSPDIAGLKSYPDQPKVEDQTTFDGIDGVRVEASAIVPTQPGTVELPEISISWWDTDKDKLRRAIVPAKTLTVLPASESSELAQEGSLEAGESLSSPATGATSSAELLVWQFSTLALTVLWLLTLVYLWLRRQVPSPMREQQEINTEPDNEKAAYKALASAARSSDAEACATALLRWGRQFWPERNVHSLQDVCRLSGHKSLDAAVMAMERSRYAASVGGSWNGDSLLSIIDAVRSEQSASNSDDSLPSLYPA